MNQHLDQPVEPAARSDATRAIAVRNLVKRFGHLTVLDEVSLEIPDGELLVVLGPSGSGKTTLLRIIAGLEEPDAGEVWLGGAPATHLPPQDRRVGVVFQEHALFQRMTVEQNIAFGLRVRRLPAAHVRRAVDEMLDMVRLEGHRHKRPGQLSGGQRQRVALARALAYQPDAVLLDEPFSSLDAVTRAELRREVRRLLRRLNVPALFITHDQEEALEIADRIAILNQGRIQQIGTPFEIYNHPCNEFVATFLGAANVLLGRWVGGRVVIGGLRLEPPAETPPLAEHQMVKAVFRPEDVLLNFQPQFLATPYYLGRAVVEEVFYVGPAERLSVRLRLWPPESPRRGHLVAVNEAYADGFPITLTRSKWEVTDMNLAPGDAVAVGLKDYRLLAHYPLAAETSARPVGR